MREGGIIVIGAGVGGLAAAIDLAAGGARVTVLERAPRIGGKLSEVTVGGQAIDRGPTVFTMRAVFEALFARAGARLADHLTLTPARTLARHAWPGGASLDLFADMERTVDAIGRFSGAADAAGYRRFAADAQRIHDTLNDPFIHGQKPSLSGLICRVAAARPRDLWCIQPYSSLWRALGRYFRDARLRQLLGRYATYAGSSPFEAPATLMLIAHVERRGVWLIEGGMRRLAEALGRLAEGQGATIATNAAVAEILTRAGRVSGVRLASGEVLAADAVICNADVSALATGLFGQAARRAVAPVPQRRRSLSAMTWAMRAVPAGFPLLRHTVFFSADCPGEFADIRDRRRVPLAPTVYVCAQDRPAHDRSEADAPAPGGRERLFCVVNAPATGDGAGLAPQEIRRCSDSLFASLAACGLLLEPSPHAPAIMTPADFAAAYPGTGGAIYGRASHGWMASFQRAGARTRLPGLYCAGGSCHPGAGLPMAALSGRLAAQALRADWVSQGRSRPVAMSGGMSTA